MAISPQSNFSVSTSLAVVKEALGSGHVAYQLLNCAREPAGSLGPGVLRGAPAALGRERRVSGFSGQAQSGRPAFAASTRGFRYSSEFARHEVRLDVAAIETELHRQIAVVVDVLQRAHH